MRYIALGDSLSINPCVGPDERSAPDRFAEALGASLVAMAFDGCTTVGMLDALDEIDVAPDLITVTVAGSDLLQLGAAAATQRLQSVPKLASDAAEMIVGNLDSIFDQIAQFGCSVIVGSIYDPIANGDPAAERLGLPSDWRVAYDAVNSGIESLAAKYGFLVCDLNVLLGAHGEGSDDCWIVDAIQPTANGAAALAGALQACRSKASGVEAVRQPE